MQIHVQQPSIRVLLRRLLQAGLQAVDPGQALQHHVSRVGKSLQVGSRRYDLRRYRSIVVAGAGKASATMAAALEQVMGAFLSQGLVIVKYGHTVPTARIEIEEAGHPIPDRAGQQSTARLLRMVAECTSDDLLIFLLSGGASSLLPAPVPGITLGQKRSVSRLLLRSGATIQEVNTVRKHLSMVKGGRLAAVCRAQIVSLILSDVLGDDLGSIGSGPTAPDPSTYLDARTILERYRLWSRVPSAVRAHLLEGQQCKWPETPKPDSRVFRKVHNHLIGSNHQAIQAVARAAAERGLSPLILSTSLIGEARETAKVFGAIAREIAASGAPVARPVCVLAGGELTVTVRGAGWGGRAQEFALAAAREIEGLPNTWIVGFGTDGTDGPTPAAGAVVDGNTWARARRAECDPELVLERHDAYPFFQRVGGHIVTGPTGTNVSDLYLLLVL